ncbi:hypothetical protein [Cellulophaga sp. Z1A5H]|uniref:hypothetical protein n=1 Tax=Cellulophaga sp. Z1A5H TaxID=2687291 RepID=UPI0013FD65BE|nr:hypothetical protein [Cellulophaga sp. Z1A5H]
MSLAIIGLLIDFGLVVLIWMIQCIVYPSFSYYSAENLIVWHNKYTARFSFIIVPLIVLQLILSIYEVVSVANLYTILRLLLIVALWCATFFQFVPIHTKISNGKISSELLVSLVHKNWVRTVLWTLLFLLNLYYYLSFAV